VLDTLAQRRTLPLSPLSSPLYFSSPLTFLSTHTLPCRTPPVSFRQLPLVQRMLFSRVEGNSHHIPTTTILCRKTCRRTRRPPSYPHNGGLTSATPLLNMSHGNCQNR
jgi:hypothetical protein